jgi:hypothetical protein
MRRLMIYSVLVASAFSSKHFSLILAKPLFLQPSENWHEAIRGMLREIVVQEQNWGTSVESKNNDIVWDSVLRIDMWDK